MFHTYEEALNWIHGRLRLGIKPGLKRMKWMMDRLNHPEKKIKTVHIGGTNGKGSTVTILRNILQRANYKVGTFTSPYIEQFNERISVNGVPISNEHLIELTNRVKPLSDELEETELGGPTEFEVITAMSLLYFAEIEPVDVVIYEVGLGGRFDSTNVIEPVVSIITSIGLDHTNILGDTYGKIAKEKAGIIKHKTPIISAVKKEEAKDVIEKVAYDLDAPLYQLGKDFFIILQEKSSDREKLTFYTSDRKITDLSINMIGKHQWDNASLAIMAALIIDDEISDQAIQQGLFEAYWPGRFEILSDNPFVVIDGAHNEEGVQALTETLISRYNDYRKIIIFAALGDKKFDKMIKKLDIVADKMIFVDFDFPRAAKAEELYAVSQAKKKEYDHNWQDVLKKELPKIKERDMLMITGSLYFISSVKPYLRELLGK